MSNYLFNFEVENSIVEFQAIVKDYRFSHFGEEYNYMCMDAAAWKIAYQRNNELLKQKLFILDQNK